MASNFRSEIGSGTGNAMVSAISNSTAGTVPSNDENAPAAKTGGVSSNTASTSNATTKTTTRKRPRSRKRKTIELGDVRSVARPDQLEELAQPSMALVTGQQLLNDASTLLDDFNFNFTDQEDPVFMQQQQQQQQQASTSSSPAAGTTATSSPSTRTANSFTDKTTTTFSSPAPDENIAAPTMMFSPLCSKKYNSSNMAEQPQPPQPPQQEEQPLQQQRQPQQKVPPQENQEAINTQPAHENLRNSSAAISAAKFNNSARFVSGGEDDHSNNITNNNKNHKFASQAATMDSTSSSSSSSSGDDDEEEQRLQQMVHRWQKRKLAGQREKSGNVLSSRSNPAIEPPVLLGTWRDSFVTANGDNDNENDEKMMDDSDSSVTTTSSSSSSTEPTPASRDMAEHYQYDYVLCDDNDTLDEGRQDSLDSVTGDNCLHADEVEFLHAIERSIHRQEEKEFLQQIENSIQQQQQLQQQAEKLPNPDASLQEEVAADESKPHQQDLAAAQHQQDVSREQPDAQVSRPLHLQNERALRARQQQQEQQQQEQPEQQQQHQHQQLEQQQQQPQQQQRHQQQDIGSKDCPISLDSEDEEDDGVASSMSSATLRTGTARRRSGVASPQRRQQRPHFVRVTKRVPKYLDTSSLNYQQLKTAKPVLDSHVLETQIVAPFLCKHCKSSSSSSSPSVAVPSIDATMTDIPNDPHSQLISVEGPKILVEAFRLFLTRWLDRTVKQHAFQELLRDNHRKEVDVVVSRHKFMAAWAKGCIQEVSDVFETSLGLWLDLSTSDRQQSPSLARQLLDPILGEITMSSPGLMVAVLRVEGVGYSNHEQWKQVQQRLSQKLPSSELKVTLCVGGHTRLDYINMSYVVGDIRCCDDGTLPPAEIQVDVASNMDISSLNQSVTQQVLPGTDRHHRGAHGEKWNAYNMFKVKYKKIRQIEYGRSDINGQFCFKEMWSQHKERFGASACGDDCDCALHLDYLTATVVQAFEIQQQKRHPDWNAPREWSNSPSTRGSPVGFVNNFVPKFRPLVREKYPNEPLLEFLRRLVKMWQLHTQQRRFGSTCDRTCECGSGWIHVFHEGDVLRELPQESRNRRPPPHVPEAVLPPIPRKRSRLNHEIVGPRGAVIKPSPNPTVITGECNGSRIAATSNSAVKSLIAGFHRPGHDQQKGDSSSINTKKQRNSNPPTPAVLKPYSVSFDAKTPLGLYCVTDVNRSGDRVCKVLSLAPAGKAVASNAMIQEGSSVISVEVWQGKQRMKYQIKEHDDLFRYYTYAKNQSSSEIVICFLNDEIDDVDKQSVLAKRTREWTEDGRWRGDSCSGWPGGAPRDLASRPRERERGGIPLAPVAPLKPQKPLGASFQSTSETIRAHHEKKALPSILKVPSAGTWPKNHVADLNAARVRFKQSHTERLYDPTCQILKETESKCRTVEEADQNLYVSQPAHNSKEMIALHEATEAVKNDALAEVVRILQSGTVRTDHVLENGKHFLTEQYAYAKAHRFENIVKILKIYKAAEGALLLHQNIKASCGLKLQIRRLSNFRLRGKSPDVSSIKTVRCYIFLVPSEKKPRKLLKTEDKMVTEIVDFTSNNASCSECRLDYIPGDMNEICIEVHPNRKLEGESKVPRLVLPVFDLEQSCRTGRKSVLISRALQSCDQSFVSSGATIEILVEREVEHSIDKQSTAFSNCLKEIKNMIDWIDLFNKEKPPGVPALTSQICGKQNISVLHAAIYLRQTELVKKLLARGADPIAKSAVGAAAVYARKLVHQAKEKYELFTSKTEEETPNSQQSENEEFLERLRANFDASSDIAAMILKQSNYTDKDGSAHPTGSRPTKCLMEVTFYTFLECIQPKGSSDDEWRSMTVVERAFSQKTGKQNAILFGAYRSAATEEKLIEWGAIDEETLDFRVVAPGDFATKENEASLRLTPKGQCHVQNQPPRAVTSIDATETEMPLAGSKSISHSENQSIPKAHDVTMFLKCVEPRGSSGDVWVSMNTVSKTFLQISSDENVIRFRFVRNFATAEKYVEWGRFADLDEEDDCEDYKVASPEDFDTEDAAEASLRLTESGKRYLSENSTADDSKVHNDRDLSRNSAIAKAKQAGKGLQTWKSTMDMKRFLCFMQMVCQGGSQWISQKQCQKAFLKNFGPPFDNAQRADETAKCFKFWCDRAAKDKFISWGTPDPTRINAFEVCTDQQVVGHNGLKLTEAGEHFLSRKVAVDDSCGESAIRKLGCVEDQVSTQYEDSASVSARSIGSTSQGCIAAFTTRQNRHWFLPSAGRGRETCRRFKNARNVKCWFESRCNFAHIQPRLGRIALSSFSAPVSSLRCEDIMFCMHLDSRLLTAAYRDPLTHIYFVAECGDVVEEGSTGIHWYTSRETAKRAVEVVYAAATSHHSGRPSPLPQLVSPQDHQIWQERGHSRNQEQYRHHQQEQGRHAHR